MKPLAEAFAVEHGCEMEDTDTGETLVCRNCTRLAAVVAEWLESDEAAEVVAEVIDRNVEAEDYLPIYSKDGSRCVDSGAAKAALDALAAHAKGEAS